MQLDNRLLEIAKLVNGYSGADIGTDHGYLIAKLVKDGTLQKGIASDINQKPLESARRHIAALGLQNKIDCVLCSGLQGILPDSVDTIIIAGMGGSLIAQIIDEAPWLKNPQKHLLLQPMTKPELLREFLAQNGYCILAENAVCSGKFVYSVFSVRYDGIVRELSLLGSIIGKVTTGKTKDTEQYLAKKRSQALQRAKGLQQSDPQSMEAKVYFDLAAQIEKIIAKNKGEWQDE